MLLKTVNLKSDLPTVEQARSRLRAELNLARQQGFKVLKIIHGWGSHGVGGDLRFALQATLAAMVTERDIAAFIPGEQWRVSDETTWKMLKLHTALKKDSDLGKENKGISIILL